MKTLGNIEIFLTSNSSMRLPDTWGNLLDVSPDTAYRPDRVFSRDDLMKWAMILNGIDTPHRMAAGAMFRELNAVAVKSELLDLQEFKV